MQSEIAISGCFRAIAWHKRVTAASLCLGVVLLCGCSPNDDPESHQPRARVDHSNPNTLPFITNEEPAVNEELTANSSRSDGVGSELGDTTAIPSVSNDDARVSGDSVDVDIVPFKRPPGQAVEEMVLDGNAVFDGVTFRRYTGCLRYANARSNASCILSDRLAARFEGLLNTKAMVLNKKFLQASRPYGSFSYGELVFECHHGLL